MRRLSFLLLLLACAPPKDLAVGGECYGDNIGRCEPSGTRLMECVDEKWTVYSDCFGPNGCSMNNDTANCDTSGNSIGSRCAPTSEGRVRCDPDGGLNILRCVNGTLVFIDACQAPMRCGLTDGGLTCIY